ncbi:hypothetical protein ETAA8_32800 [Anatilimnocola aggregata]|uniref:Uncharacterized protein n=1 Tax=Anatilimnocola aggregata TaxID=2528021 RepID=A0A517YD66_9BACT|nr:hypothetical protein [Anatilimnocola aggregata]QDU28180.1 hypothetical protein ETAA8_32800 [Anatilimnocola aggregata]
MTMISLRKAAAACWLTMLVGAAMLATLPAAAQSGARVSLEVVTQPGFSAEEIREWLPALEKAGFSNVRVRTGRDGDGAAIVATGSGNSANYQVTAVLTSDNRLHLPNGNYSFESRGKINAWVEKLKAGGEEGLNARAGAFGLVPKDLVAVHEGLTTKVNFSTTGKTTREVVQAIAVNLPIGMKVDPAVRDKFGEEKVTDELLGMSSGTALAAAIRPLGLVLLPAKVGNDVTLRVLDSQAAEQVWPVGWPMKTSPRETLPDLFKFLNVEVSDASLAESVEAIRGRLNVPMIIDQNSLARQKIDFATVKVTLPKTNTYYAKILERLLFQAKLKYELRIDEADRPFLWITTVKQ